MEFICKGCEEIVVAVDMEEIKKCRKLCDSCLSASNRESLVRVKPRKGKSRSKDIRYKPNKSDVHTFVCNNCDHDCGRDSKPWSCKICNRNSFRRVIKN